MILWPHWPVWPFFLVGCGILWIWNREAAGAFAAYWLGFQVLKAVSPDQFSYFVFISLLSAIVFLRVDRIAGTFMAAVGVIYAMHLIEGLGQFPKVVLTDVLIGLGMVTSGILGPTGGLLDSVSGYFGNANSDRIYRGSMAHKKTGGLDKKKNKIEAGNG